MKRSGKNIPRLSCRNSGRLHRRDLKAYRKRGFAFSLNFAPRTGRISGLCHLPTSTHIYPHLQIPKSAPFPTSRRSSKVGASTDPQKKRPPPRSRSACSAPRWDTKRELWLNLARLFDDPGVWRTSITGSGMPPIGKRTERRKEILKGPRTLP